MGKVPIIDSSEAAKGSYKKPTRNMPPKENTHIPIKPTIRLTTVPMTAFQIFPLSFALRYAAHPLRNAVATITTIETKKATKSNKTVKTDSILSEFPSDNRIRKADIGTTEIRNKATGAVYTIETNTPKITNFILVLSDVSKVETVEELSMRSPPIYKNKYKLSYHANQ
jgi:hypothetical protein